MTEIAGEGVIEQEPTIHEILVRAKELKSDRLSLQCVPSLEAPAGICVILVGAEAIRDISPILITTANVVGEVKPEDRLAINFTDNAAFIFQWLVDNEIPWTYATFEFDEQPVMLFAIVGTKVCLELCEPLTNLGCPTDLS